MNDLERVRAARDLKRLAADLEQPQRAELVQHKLVEVGHCLRKLRLAAYGQRDRDNPAISRNVHDEAAMQSVAEVLQSVFDGLGFALLVFEVGEGGGRTNYCSNCLRDDIVVAMREFIATHEGRAFPEPPAEPQ